MQNRTCKVCGKDTPPSKDYCSACRMQLENGGKLPLYICADCGAKYGEKKNGGKYELDCYREGVCHVCEKKAPVTHYRLFGYLAKGEITKKINLNKIRKTLTPTENGRSKHKATK